MSAQRDHDERQDIADGPAGRLGGCIAFLLTRADGPMLRIVVMRSDVSLSV